MGVGVGIKNENHTGGKILHGTSVQSIESIQTFQSIFSVHVSSEPMVSLSIRLWFPPDIFQSQFRMPLWQTNIRRRTPKPGPNFKPGESTIWPLTINTLQKNNQMIQIPEIWNCIGFLPCFEHPVHESTKVCQRWNATNDLSKSCTLMPQGLTALHHFEELQLQKLQTVGSTNCELSCGIRIAVDLHQRKCQHMRDEKLTASLHRLGSTCGDGSHQRRLSHLRQSFDKISTCFSRFSLVVLWEWNVWSSHKNDLKSAAFTDFHQISTGFHNLKKWCEYSVESLQSKEPILPCFQFSFLKMWLLYKLSHQRWAYPNR